MDTFLIIANWKANKTVEESNKWFSGYQPLIATKNLERITTIIAPPYTLLQWFKTYHGDITLASQDTSMYPGGPYTGEIPAPLLADLGVKYCLIGHSERRRFQKETNTEVEAKLKVAIANKITPIICSQTIDEIPPNIRNYDPAEYLIMYEPSYAISTKGEFHPESPERIEGVFRDWQTKLNLKCGLLYGGSVTKSIISNLLTISNPLFTGLVVGQASLDPQEFSAIIVACQKGLTSR